MPKYGELTAERDKLIVEARSLDKAASEGKRKLAADEQEKWDKCFTRVDEIDAECKRALRMEQAEADAIAVRARDAGRKPDDLPLAGSGSAAGGSGGKLETRSFKVHGSEFRCEPGTPIFERSFGKYRESFRSWLGAGDRGLFGVEYRALQTDIDTKGGFLTTPEEFIAELIKDLDDQVFMRGIARRFATRAQSIGAPRRTAKASTWVKGGELATPVADTALAFGKRKLEPHHFSGEISVSNDLLGSAVMSVEQIVIDELNLDRAELEESLFMTGTGAQEPLGIFTASADGISTGRDVSTDNTTTTITADGLLEAMYSLKANYQRESTWLFGRTAIKQIRKLKTGDGQYIWNPGLSGGQPGTILDRPYIMSEWVPNVFTTGLYVGIIGNFQWYWIVDGLEIGLKRDGDSVTAARANQVYFVARVKFDGAPVKEEAFARVKLA